MKNSIIYTLVFLALQIIATFAVTTTWALINKSTDFSIMPLIISITLFSGLLTKQWTVLVWAVIAALGLVIPITWLQEQMPELPNWIEDDLQMLMSSYWGYLAIGLLAPLAEEVVFRGAVLRSLLTQMKPWTAIAISALLFSIVHMNPAQMPFAFLAGILLGWMYWRTGSILPGMAYHWANNSIAYIILRTYPDPEFKLIDIFQGSQTHVYMAVFFSLLIVAPALYQLHLRMKRSEK